MLALAARAGWRAGRTPHRCSDGRVAKTRGEEKLIALLTATLMVVEDGRLFVGGSSIGECGVA